MGDVVLVLITLSGALAVGYARGGRLRHLLQVRPRRGRLLLTALSIAVIGVFLGWVWPAAATVSWSLTLVTVGWYCWLNRAVHGATLVATGLWLNALAWLVRLLPDPPGAASILGDVIPVVSPWEVQRIGVGDVLVAAGLAAILATCMTVTPDAVHRDADETLGISEEHAYDQQEVHTHGEASPQAQGPEEERSEPRQAPQQLTHHPS